MTKISLRQLQPGDSEALYELFDRSPDTGQFAISPQYQIPLYKALVELGSTTVGVIAEIPNTGEVVGIGLVDIQARRINGVLSPCALLNSLIVHPSYRRQGVATQLAKWRIDYVREQLGKEATIMALIQKDNAGSLAAAQKWQAQPVGHYRNSLIRVRTTRPDVDSGLTVRAVKESELEQVAHHLNTFYQDYDFYIPQNGQSLGIWLQQSPFEEPFRQYYVAVNEKGSLLAGLSVAEHYRIVNMRVQRMPGAARLLNRVVKMVPPDGVLRQMSVNKIWFAPGHLSAARNLWEHTRWLLRNAGSHLVCSYDPGSPVPAIINPPFWLPKGASVVVAQSAMAVGDRLICYA